jgi:hypothetical protein
MGKAISGIVGGVANIFTGSDSTAAAGQQASAAQAQAARDAAAAAAFRPVGMTTRFGTSQFTRETDPRTGMPYISAAGYTPATELAGIQDRLFGQFGAGLTQAEQMAQQYAPLSAGAQSLFGLGQQYLATSPQQAAQTYMQEQQALLAPQREQQLSGLQNRLFQTGRSGLATGGTAAGGRGQTNPEMQAYYNALAQQDLALASQANQAGMQRATYGAGLLGTAGSLLGAQTAGQAGAYSPLQAQLGLSGQVEQMAQQPYQMGLQLGTAQMPGQQAGSQQYYGGQVQGAATQYGAAQAAANMNNQFLQSAISAGAAGAGGGGGGGGGLFGGNAGSGFGGFQNFMVRGENQASPDFVGAPYSRFN